VSKGVLNKGKTFYYKIWRHRITKFHSVRLLVY